MKPTSLTLARFRPCAYQVTYWQDGIARWDAAEGLRIGAWQATVSLRWFRRAALLASTLRKANKAPEPDVTIIVESPGRQINYGAKQGQEPNDLWLLATVLDGMATNTPWAPFDMTGVHDLSRWESGVQMSFVKGSYSAQALARPEGLVLLAGSQAATATLSTLEDNYKRQRAAFVADGTFELRHDRFTLLRHLFFRTPSAAASIVAGSNTNGRSAWRDELGRTWADLGLD